MEDKEDKYLYRPPYDFRRVANITHPKTTTTPPLRRSSCFEIWETHPILVCAFHTMKSFVIRPDI